jgi:hypothetical protein
MERFQAQDAEGKFYQEMPRVKAGAAKGTALKAKRTNAAPAQLFPTAEIVVAKSAKKKTNGGGDLGFEATLWSTADQLRGSMDASEYKHPVLGLIFLKYISDAFEEKHAQLAQDPDSESRGPGRIHCGECFLGSA